MKNLFKFSLCVITATASLFAGCSKDYSDDIDRLNGEVKELQDIKNLLGGKVITNIEQNYTQDGVKGTRITYTPLTGGTASYAFIPNGATGATGATPVISIVNGFWTINGVATTEKAQGPAGAQGPKGDKGEIGAQGPIGTTGATGAAGDYVKVEANKPVAGSTTITIMDGVTKQPKAGQTPVVIKNGEDGDGGDGVTAKIENGALKVFKIVDGIETPVGQIKAPTITTVYDYAENAGKMTVVVTNYNFDGSEVSPKQYIKTDLPQNTNSLVRCITTAGDTDDFYTFELGDGTQMRVLRRVPAIPQSLTILKEKVVVNRYGEAVVTFRVNPSNVVITDKQYLDLDYVQSYSRAIAGNAPTNVEIKELNATTNQGEYEVTLAWKSPAAPNFDIEPVFLIVNYTDPNDENEVKKLVSVTSSTPIRVESTLSPITASTITTQEFKSILNNATYQGEVVLNDPTLKPAISDLVLSVDIKKDPATAAAYVSVSQKADDKFAFTVDFDNEAANAASLNWNYIGFNVKADFEDIDDAGNSLTATVIPMVIDRKAYTVALSAASAKLPGTSQTAVVTDANLATPLAAIKTCDKLFKEISAFAADDYTAATMTTTVAPASTAVTAAFDNATKEYKVTISDAATAGDYTLTSVLSIAGREITITKQVSVEYPKYTINVKSDANFTATLPAPFAALTDPSLTSVWKSVSYKATQSVKLSDIVDIATLTHDNSGITYRFKNALGLTTPITTAYTFTTGKWGDMGKLIYAANNQKATLFVELSTGQVIPVSVCKAGNMGGTTPIVAGDKSNELNILIYNAKAKEVAIDVTGGATSFVYTVNRADADLGWTIKVNDFAAVDMLTDSKDRIPTAGQPKYSIDRTTDAISAIDAATGKLTFSKVWSPRANDTYTITVSATDIWGVTVTETQDITVTDR